MLQSVTNVRRLSKMFKNSFLKNAFLGLWSGPPFASNLTYSWNHHLVDIKNMITAIIVITNFRKKNTKT